MTPFEKIRNIEAKYSIDKLKYKDVNYWPLFRAVILNEILYGENKGILTKPISVLSKLKSAFFGFPNWFKKVEYIAFSNELERKEIEGKTIDKLLEKTITNLGYKKVLYIENCSNHLNKKKYGNKQVCSWNLILFLIGIVSVFTKRIRRKFEGYDVLEKLSSDEEITTNLKIKFFEFQAKVFVLKIFFKMYKPKCIFITDYGYYPMTYAAKKLGIKVVEFQHGVIGKVHPYYHPVKKLNSDFCPDYLFVFGDHDKNCLQSGNYVDQKNIIPIGNFYLEYIVKKDKHSRILKLIKPYNKSICIPTDHVTQQDILIFISKAATKLPDVIFIIVPREYKAFEVLLDTINLENIYVEKELSFQETVRHCYYHSCSISTCSLEALSLGVPNILIDEDGNTSSYYGELLNNPKTTKFAKSVNEYIKFVQNFVKPEKQKIIDSNSINYKANYSKNLDSALKFLYK
ncbi:hypothetical protein ATO12_22830 [Aquimarina atlantica]|uniref:Glycosyl transferase family 1 domain-containing protein n=1 Tax=Aquimarina atlantica TaxID=1317122 RepID=A0A023BQE5_9FLAO|nr:hypothetical protein [Aquimarina atlantica]EZH72290.1 hypothetical protein ATO12_22830 [Aquimarina atlantica]